MFRAFTGPSSGVSLTVIVLPFGSYINNKITLLVVALDKLSVFTIHSTLCLCLQYTKSFKVILS
jgi:hypothetical protein